MWRRANEPPFVVLWRAFLTQFFTSESVTSDVQLRQTMIWVLAFLLPPGMFLMIEVFPLYEMIIRFFPERIDELLAKLAFIFVTYSMVTVGFIAVFVWDALTFDRRDAMVLGPLPLRGTTIITAKLAALGTFLLGTSAAVNLVTAVPFALVTADRLGAAVCARHVAAHLTATLSAATFVFAGIVMIRGTVALLGGARLAAGLGSLLQLLFVSALLCFAIMIPAALKATQPWFLDAGAAGWIPTAWFLGLFERLRGSPRPELVALADRALLATPIAVVGGVIVSVAGFGRQMQLALAPSASTGPLGAARISRMLARWLVGGNAVARATVDFILITIARNRAQQAPIAINAAVGLAIVVAALSSRAGDLAALVRPRTAVLWIPLVMAYWTTVGLRASFFVPSELPASWSFQANAPEAGRAYWSAVRASMMAFLIPPTLLLIAVLFVPLLGWRVAGWHALVVCAMVILLVEVVALTIHYIPFTRAYEPGHAKLKTRWPVYALGLYAFAYLPVRLELRILGTPAALLKTVACIAAVIALLEVVGRRTAGKWMVRPREESADDPFGVTMLDIGGVIDDAPVGGYSGPRPGV